MHRKRADMQLIVMDLNKSINPISLVVGMAIDTIFNSFLVVVQVTRARVQVVVWPYTITYSSALPPRVQLNYNQYTVWPTTTGL